MQRTFQIDALQHFSDAPASIRLHVFGGGGLIWRAAEIIAMIPPGDIATKILAHLKLPKAAKGFLPIRAPPWADDFAWAEAGSGRTNGAPVPDLDALDDAA